MRISAAALPVQSCDSAGTASARAAGFAGKGTILADDEYLAGNMRVQFPEARVMAARYPLFRPPQRSEERARASDLRDAEFIARVGCERVMGRELIGDLPGEARGEAAPDIDGSEFGALPDGVGREFLLLARKVRLL